MNNYFKEGYESAPAYSDNLPPALLPSSRTHSAQPVSHLHPIASQNILSSGNTINNNFNIVNNIMQLNNDKQRGYESSERTQEMLDD